MLTRLSSTPAQGRELEQRKATGMVLQAQPICILLLLGKYNVPTLSRLPLLLNINLQSLLILVIIKRNKRDARINGLTCERLNAVEEAISI